MKKEILEVFSVKMNGDIFNIGDTVIHIDGTYKVKIEKFCLPGSIPILTWFYDTPELTSVKNLINFKKIDTDNIKKEFTKSDLETGYLIVARNGMMGIVFMDKEIIISNGGNFKENLWKDLHNWTDDLRFISCNPEDYAYDIVKVYRYAYNSTFNSKLIGEVLLWERESSKMITIKDREYSEDTILKALQSYCNTK